METSISEEFCAFKRGTKSNCGLVLRTRTQLPMKLNMKKRSSSTTDICSQNNQKRRYVFGTVDCRLVGLKQRISEQSKENLRLRKYLEDAFESINRLQHQVLILRKVKQEKMSSLEEKITSQVMTDVLKQSSRIELKAMAQNFAAICDKLAADLGSRSPQVLENKSQQENLQKLFKDLELLLSSVKERCLITGSGALTDQQNNQVQENASFNMKKDSESESSNQFFRNPFPFMKGYAPPDNIPSESTQFFGMHNCFSYSNSTDLKFLKQNAYAGTKNLSNHGETLPPIAEQHIILDNEQIEQVIEVLDELYDQRLVYLIHSGKLSTQNWCKEKNVDDPEKKDQLEESFASETQPTCKPVEELSADEVSSVLLNLGLDAYVDIFHTNDICGKKLLKYLEGDSSLVEMNWIHERMLLKAVRQMQGTCLSPLKKANYQPPRKSFTPSKQTNLNLVERSAAIAPTFF